MRRQEIEWVFRQMNWDWKQAADSLGYSVSHLKNMMGGQREVPAGFRTKLKHAVEKEIKLSTKRYSNLRSVLDCQEGLV